MESQRARQGVPAEKSLCFSCVLVWLGLLLLVNRAWWPAAVIRPLEAGAQAELYVKALSQRTKTIFKNAARLVFKFFLTLPQPLLRTLPNPHPRSDPWPSNEVEQVVGWGGVGAPGWAAAGNSCRLSKGWARPAADVLVFIV